jgi:hypothetical protein
MSMSRLGTGRRKDIADALRGSGALFAILGAFIGLLAVPVYFVASFLSGLGWADWINALCCVALAAAELYVLVLIPEYLDRRDDRREREAMETAAITAVPRYQPPAKESEFAAATERLSA